MGRSLDKRYARKDGYCKVCSKTTSGCLRATTLRRVARSRRMPSSSDPIISRLSTLRKDAQSGAKRILIDATRDLLPPELDKQQKKGFGMPYEKWLNGPLREILDDTLSRTSVRARGLFDPNEVERTLLDFRQGKGSWALPWTLMMTELWCRSVLDAMPLQLARTFK